jgi:hypothetical protein
VPCGGSRARAAITCRRLPFAGGALVHYMDKYVARCRGRAARKDTQLALCVCLRRRVRGRGYVRCRRSSRWQPGLQCPPSCPSPPRVFVHVFCGWPCAAIAAAGLRFCTEYWPSAISTRTPSEEGGEVGGRLQQLSAEQHGRDAGTVGDVQEAVWHVTPLIPGINLPLLHFTYVFIAGGRVDR